MRVTEALRAAGLAPDYSMIPADVLEHAAERGRAVHKAIELHELGDLDESSLHPEVKPYFEAYLKFRGESGFRYELGEMELISVRWLLMGHPDCVGWLGTDRVLVDFKCLQAIYLDSVAFQTAGYQLLWEETHPAEPIAKCFALQLMPDATYKLHPLTRPDARQVFLAALIVAHAQRRR